ncbi:MAG: hypothetical protein HLX50_00905 [Alteromonadaceae bacterium]|nr:hypothetical protein [Alteromonadaceae bacterium]
MSDTSDKIGVKKVIGVDSEIEKNKEIIKSGFYKVASVIDANVAYGSILGHRIEKPEYEAISENNGLIETRHAKDFLKELFEKKKILKRVVPKECTSLWAFCYGATRNNKREFAFFERKSAELGLPLNWVNLEELQGEKVFVKNQLIKNLIVEAYAEFLSDRKAISKSMLHQTTSYALSLLAALETMNKIEPSIFVVANDHSPVPVAYTKIAEIKGAKTVYLQHAEVTESFPALDFSYSILRNKKSLDTYGVKGISGKAAFSERERFELSEDALRKQLETLRLNQSVPVVIYPSSIFNIQELISLIDALSNSNGIIELSVKFHPSFNDFKRVEDFGVSILDEMPATPHVAICGNSSVVVELVSNGNLVLNYFELDDIAKDYYGFVKAGLTTNLKLQHASENFWSNIDVNQIFRSLADYVPAIKSTRNQLEDYRYKEVFCEILAKNPIECRRQIWFERDLFLFRKSLLASLRNGRNTPYEDFWIVDNLNRLFDSRDVRLHELYKEARLDECSSVLEFWLNTKVMEWNGRAPSAKQLSVHVDFVRKRQCHRRLKGWLELKCFDIVLRFGTLTQVIDFLESAHFLNIYSIGINKKISFINFLKDKHEHDSALLKFYDVNRDQNLKDLDRVKIMVQTGVQVAGSPKLDNYRNVEDAFMKAHPRLAQEYHDLVRVPYRDLGDRTCFVDIKKFQAEEQKFVNLVKEKLKSGEGFSFIRLSDGEGFIFQNLSDHFTLEDSNNRQRHWWGEEIPTDIHNQLLFDLFEAVKTADVLGIPSIYRFVRDHSEKTRSLTQSLQGRGLISVLAGLKHVDTPNKLYTDDKANIATLNKIEVIADLAKNANKVIIVNSGSTNSVHEAFDSVFEFEHIQVPTHHKTSLNEKYHSSLRPLPYVYREVAKKIEAVTAPGTLVLVGAGVAGKVFMHVAKKRGGVALDLGSAMDQFLSGGIHSLF